MLMESWVINFPAVCQSDLFGFLRQGTPRMRDFCTQKRGERMRLLFSTASHLQITLTEQFGDSIFKLYFADAFNASANPASSNPFRIFLDYQEIFDSNDRLNPKYVMHVRGLRRGTQRRLRDSPYYTEARRTISAMGIHAIRPVLAILEADTYLAHGKRIDPLPPSRAGSPTSVEYLLPEIHGPKHPDPELHLECLFP